MRGEVERAVVQILGGLNADEHGANAVEQVLMADAFVDEQDGDARVIVEVQHGLKIGERHAAFGHEADHIGMVCRSSAEDEAQSGRRLFSRRFNGRHRLSGNRFQRGCRLILSLDSTSRVHRRYLLYFSRCLAGINVL